MADTLSQFAKEGAWGLVGGRGGSEGGGVGGMLRALRTQDLLLLRNLTLGSSRLSSSILQV